MAIKNYLLHIDEAAGAGTKNYYVPFDRLVNVDAVTIVANDTVTAHAANYVTLTFYGNDGATALCARNTDSGGTGTTITAGTSEDLTMSNAGKADFTGAQSMKIASVQAGSGVATNVVLNIQVSDAREY
jgi:hypothetical protein